MNIVVIGGSGLIGSRLVRILRDRGHDAIGTSSRTGVNTLTGEGLAGAIAGAEVVVDVTNSPSFERAEVLRFFETSTRNLVAAMKAAGTRHFVALSIVGVDTIPENAYFHAKIAQETLIRESGIPHTIVRATQFMEFLGAIADTGFDGKVVRVPPALLQLIAADDVAVLLAHAATSPPAGTMEIAGPEVMTFEDAIRQLFAKTGDTRAITVDPAAGYFYAPVQERSLIPRTAHAKLGAVSLDEWLARQS